VQLSGTRLTATMNESVSINGNTHRGKGKRRTSWARLMRHRLRRVGMDREPPSCRSIMARPAAMK
jgi:hypothetical protein